MYFVALIPLPVLSLAVLLEICDYVARSGRRAYHLFQIYDGPIGIVVYVFGTRATWKLQAQILGRRLPVDAEAFKAVVQGQCNMISIAAAIVAQISITALALDYMDKTHWLVRGFLNFSLISALMAVYYAVSQYRSFGSLLEPEQMRSWIRRGRSGPSGRIVPTLRQLLPSLDPMIQGLASFRNNTTGKTTLVRRFVNWLCYGLSLLFGTARAGESYKHCEPDDFIPGSTTPDQLLDKIRGTCFRPSVSAVIAVTAPQALLSASLFSLLFSLGIYLGFRWTRHFPGTRTIDDRNVFIMYLASLVVCLVVYLLSIVLQNNKETRSEIAILDRYIADFIDENRKAGGWVVNWEARHETIPRRGTQVICTAGSADVASLDGSVPHSLAASS